MDEIAALKQLQAGLNASFEAVFNAKDVKSLATAKEGLVGLSYATAGAALGPAFSIISLSGMPVHYMVVRIAVDLDLFELIAAKPHTLDDLVQATKADRKLLKRIVRMVTAIGWLKQTEIDKWEATPLTVAATAPALRNWLIAHFDSRMSVYSEFPEYLRKHQFQTSWADDTDNIWSQVNGENCWSYMDSHPEYRKIFDSAMSIQESFPPEMTPSFPFSSSEISKIKQDPDAVTLVDVGGGAGQAIESIKKIYPDLKGRFILQDLPKSIANLPPNKAQSVGFEAQTHDFFQPQPVQGAKFYHLRRVLHDWDDETSLKILAALRPALDPSYSKLLIVDYVLEDINPGPTETLVDMMMMVTCNGGERSISEWHALLGKAGFKIDRILRAEIGATAVIEASVV